MRLRAALIASVVLTGAFAADASADLRLDGHGHGHGVGMSQYGAYGYALKTRHSYRYILGHYLGNLQDVVVTARNSSGRAAKVEVRGSAGTFTASGVEIQEALGLKSTMFSTTFTP